MSEPLVTPAGIDLAPPALPAAAVAADAEIDVIAALPGDHPAWQRDVLAISARVRTTVALLRPVVLRVFSFWDHLTRSVGVGGGRTLELDPSGSYRLR